MAAQARKVLFVTSDDPAKCMIAEAIMNRLGGKKFSAFSAVLKPSNDLSPIVVDMLKSNRLPSDRLPQPLERYCGEGAPTMDFVIMLEPRRTDDIFAGLPGRPMKVNWRISDAAGFRNDPRAQAHAFRKTYFELENRIKLFVLVQREGKAGQLAA
jgi:protein-tyrosine-phosphatase